ncbi:2-oxoglutarate dehydrogenase E1 component [Exiguobacterium sp. s95]|uniref:2-oxoglutarate dehydrogenase E1 component n=1 Tax=Exiguobacterium sp. s95 TaxID=2751211 RepID=UPI001BEA2747|nr:2-oxoglutarate dehydrogenase E1 component [Exiguobacterium sp. s95]
MKRGEPYMASREQEKQAFYGPNLGYIIEMYERFLEDASSIDEETRAYFETHGAPVTETVTPVHVETGDFEKYLAAHRLAERIRAKGHLAADIYPLKDHPRENELLELEQFGLTEADLRTMPVSLVCPDPPAGLSDAFEAIEHLKAQYTGAAAVELQHVDDLDEKKWLRQKVEQGALTAKLTNDQKKQLFKRLAETELFEKFLHKTYVGQKRFSIEGLDAMVPLLDTIIGHLIANGSETINIGMAHRGRLNVLAHVLGKPYEMIFAEFQHAPNHDLVPSEGSIGITYGWTGDVKYHLGLNRKMEQQSTNVRVTLANNPSHLEFVDPVVEGFTRAAQDDRSSKGMPTQSQNKAAAILIHGDAAFPGQGIVAETLNMTNLKGYNTGGTIHIIANNTIGFTTEPTDSRSTRYSSDLAKGYEIPIFHVNADQPESCLAVALLASEYRAKFNKDVLIDLIGYRRFGHNEMDEPMNTNPVLYELIHKHDTARVLYAKDLVERGEVSQEEVKTIEAEISDVMKAAREKVPNVEKEYGGIMPDVVFKGVPSIETGVEKDKLIHYNDQLLAWPSGFTVFHKLEKVLKRRTDALTTHKGIDWGHAETLAFASILSDGTPIRLSGQDSERGTFAQRNINLNDVKTGKSFSPMHELESAQASFAVYNSPLSEAGVLGFEYGYNVFAPETLVLWEAQYGDFANSGQVIFDQFIAASRAKWGQTSGLVMLLPHGYEGQGPEHSSGRLERFLTLSGEKNWTVANVTSAAQYFHLLRRQAAILGKDEVRPLVVMTPKSLLRHPLATSDLSELTSGSFKRIVEQEGLGQSPERVERLVFATGKVAIDLADALAKSDESYDWLHIVRVEEIYPFPAKQLKELVARYPNVTEVVWVQEEPKNMGAWSYIEPRLESVAPNGITQVRYIGRRRRSSTAEGDPTGHKVEQARTIHDALTRTAARTENEQQTSNTNA